MIKFFAAIKLLWKEPEVLALVHELYEEFKKYQREKKTREVVGAIRESFKNKDAATLERAFDAERVRYRDIR